MANKYAKCLRIEADKELKEINNVEKDVAAKMQKIKKIGVIF